MVHQIDTVSTISDQANRNLIFQVTSGDSRAHNGWISRRCPGSARIPEGWNLCGFAWDIQVMQNRCQEAVAGCGNGRGETAATRRKPLEELVFSETGVIQHQSWIRRKKNERVACILVRHGYPWCLPGFHSKGWPAGSLPRRSLLLGRQAPSRENAYE